MPPRNLICVVIDRLHAGMLGAYGNSWIKSKHFDRLASESFLFDQAYVDSPRLDLLYRAYWAGRHAAFRDAEPIPGHSFPEIVAQAGWHTALVCDDPEVAAQPLASQFAERVPLDAADRADDNESTQLERLFGTAIDWLAAPRAPFCLWVHARAMAGDWDAPYALRSQFADEEDPPPPDFVAVPDLRLAEDHDPDELLGIAHAYAGQLTLLDRCLGALVDHLHQSGLAETTQLTVLAARGFPLGEHRRVGECDGALYNELVQIPWVMRFPDGLGRLDRSQALVQPADLPGTLLDWLGLDRAQLGSGRANSLLPIVRGAVEAIRDRAHMISDAEQALRTRAWLLRQPVGGPAELYAKPGDRWEVNEVANLCGEVVAGLQAALAQIEQLDEEGESPPLDDLLVTEVD